MFTLVLQIIFILLRIWGFELDQQRTVTLQ